MTETAIAPMRACSKCGVEKPLTREHFKINTRTKTGLTARCRPCANLAGREQWKARYTKDPERGREKTRAWRAANLEKVVEMNRRAKTDAKRVRDKENSKKRWASLTAEERAVEAERQRAWRSNNRERANELAQQYRDRQSADARKRRLESVTRSGAEWRRNNPDACRAMAARRRAAKRNADGTYSKEDVLALFNAQRGCCLYCESALETYHVDHFIPLSRGGTNWPENLVLACGSCNSQKHTKLPWEWRPDLFSPPTQ